MAERTVLLDATRAVTEAHLTLIANGTVAVVSVSPSAVGFDEKRRFNGTEPFNLRGSNESERELFLS